MRKVIAGTLTAFALALIGASFVPQTQDVFGRTICAIIHCPSAQTPTVATTASMRREF